MQRALRATSTIEFARLLLTDPASVPSAARTDPAYDPAGLTSVQYTGAASIGSVSPVQIVIAAYRVIARPSVGGRLTIHLVRADRGWRVSSLG